MHQRPRLIEETSVPYSTGGGRDLLLDVLRPDVPLRPERPAVIWVHGGGWRSGVRDPHPNRMLAERGFVTATISYRLSQEAIFPAQIHDVKAAIRFLRANAGRWGIDPQRIGIWGHSAGGHLAALAAVSGGVAELEGEVGHGGASSQVQAAVPMSPPTDFLVDWYADSGFPPHEAFSAVVELLGGNDLADPEIRERARLASPLHLAHAAAPPVLVLHGTQDDLVPIAQGRTFVDALRQQGVEAAFRELPHDGHDLPSVFAATEGAITPARQEIIEFFTQTLGPVDAP